VADQRLPGSHFAQFRMTIRNMPPRPSPIDVADLEVDPAGIVVHVIRGKTDQNAEGALVGILHASRPRLCTVATIDAWRRRLAALPYVDPADRGGPRCSGRSIVLRGRLMVTARSGSGTPERARFITRDDSTWLRR